MIRSRPPHGRSDTQPHSAVPVTHLGPAKGPSRTFAQSDAPWRRWRGPKVAEATLIPSPLHATTSEGPPAALGRPVAAPETDASRRPGAKKRAFAGIPRAAGARAGDWGPRSKI